MVDKILELNAGIKALDKKIYPLYDEAQAMENEHPRACKKNPKYLNLLAKLDALYKERDELRKQHLKATRDYLSSFDLVNPLADKKVEGGERTLQYCFNRTQSYHLQQLEIGDIWSDDVIPLCEALDKYGIKQVAFLSRSTHCLECLVLFVKAGWKVVGTYQRQFPQLDQRVESDCFYYQPDAEGLLLQK